MANRPMRREGSAQFIEVLERRWMLAATATVLLADVQSPGAAAPRVSAAAATTTLAAPTFVATAVNGHTHLITVSWRSVSGATGYRIERNDGSGWQTAGQVGAKLSFDDAGLKEQTTYRYRVVALSATASSAPSKEALGTTAAFRIFDGTSMQNRPDPLGPGIETVQLAYEHEFFDWRGWLSKSQTQAVAKKARDAGRILVVDIERWRIDIRSTPKAEVDESINNFNTVLGWIRSGAPGVKVGIINVLPLWPPSNPNDPAQVQAWRDASDYVFARLAPVDCIFTGMYANSDDPIEWEQRVEPFLKETMRFGKPSYHLISMHNQSNSQWLSGDFVRMMLATTRRYTDGAVFWAGGWQFDPNADWFKSTQQFQAEPPQPPAAVPTLNIDPLGARLYWSAPAQDTSGFFIERSTDGVNFTRVGAIGRDHTEWRDPLLTSGTPAYYRMAAVNGYGITSYSNVATDTPSRDGTIQNQGESFENGFRDQRSGDVTATADHDWFRYRDVHFDGSPTQLVIRVGVPPQNENQRVQIRLDSLDGPIIGDYEMQSSPPGWGERLNQTVAISGASGVHDVYFVYSGGTVASSLDWWSFRASGVPCGPTRLHTNSTGTSVVMGWNDNSGDETGFRVERAPVGGTFVTVATLPPNSDSYTDTSVTGGNKYRYRIVAFNDTGDSTASNITGGRAGVLNPYQRIEAEALDETGGLDILGSSVGSYHGGDWMRFFAVDFGSGAASFTTAIGVPSTDAGQYIDVRLDSPDGPVVGTLQVQASIQIDLKARNAYDLYVKAWTTYTIQSTTLSGATGIHDVYLVGRVTRNAGVGNVDWVQFAPVSSGRAVTAASVSLPSSDALAQKDDSALDLLSDPQELIA